MQKKKTYKVPSRKQPFWPIVKAILKIFYRRPEIVLTTGEMPNKAIYLANHVSKKGPMVYELYLPVFHVTWGAHEMLSDYRSRFRYLRDVFYIQKQQMPKLLASIKAGFEAFFSIYFYRGMKFIGTYPDTRLTQTINNSVSVLNDHKALLIFPEDSSDGYHRYLKTFLPGFILVAEKYYRQNGVDIPLIPLYYEPKVKKIIVGQAYYLQDLKNKGLDKNDIAQFMCNAVNDLCRNYLDK